MADNVVANPGVGGSTFAADDIAGVLHPRSKLVWGIDGVAVDASATDPLPVVQTGTPALPTGAATAIRQDTGNTSLANLDVALSTRTKPADQQHAIVDSGSLTANAGTNLNTSLLSLETTQALVKAKTDNLDVALSTRTKPADQQHAIIDSGSVTANAGTNLNTSALALDATLTGGTARAKITDGSNNAGINDSTTAANETTMDRLKVNAALRLLDTAQAVGSQLVAAKGDQTSGIWANVKASALPAGAALEAGNLATLVAAIGTASVDAAAASTLLNLLTQLGKKIDAETKAVLALAPKPAVPRSGGTLLHRN